MNKGTAYRILSTIVAVIILFPSSGRAEDIRGEKLNRLIDASLQSDLSRRRKTDRMLFLKAQWLLNTLHGEMSEKELDVERQVDRDLLEDFLSSRIDWYRTYQRRDLSPLDALPPADMIEISLDLDKGDAKALAHRIEAGAAEIRACAGKVRTVISRADADFIPKYTDALKGEIDLFTRLATENPALDQETGTAISVLTNALASLIDALDGVRIDDNPIPKIETTPRERYAYALKHFLRADVTPDQLLATAMKEYDHTLAELKECAREIDPTKTWREIVEQCKKDGAIDDVLGEARRAASRARDFAIVNALVTIPEEARYCHVLYGGENEPTPYGHYRFEEGAYIVIPIPENLSAEEREERRRESNRWWTQIVALHEAVPGHHLQFTIARNLHRSTIRQYGYTASYIEGWGLYCEEMMRLNGFYDSDKRLRLTQLKMKLWRCARAIVDVGLHCGSMTPEEAVKFLMNEVTLESFHARQEVERYLKTPTQPSAYLVGYLELMDLRRLARERLKESFDQRAFHDKILTIGPLPNRELRKIMLQWIEEER